MMGGFTKKSCSLLLLVVSAIFASLLHADVLPRSEHPEPLMFRSDWMTLNGVWEFAETDGNETYLDSRLYPDQITVPFCRESALSGLARTQFVKNVWYRKMVSLPPSWQGKQIFLHIGACDFRTTLYVNNKEAYVHQGGSSPIRADITGFLQSGENTLIVHAFDDVRSGLQAGGKQSPQPESYGCMYTRTTGIWQSVWLEAVDPLHIVSYRVAADRGRGGALLDVNLSGVAEGLKLTVRAFSDEVPISEATVRCAGSSTSLFLSIPAPRWWMPEDPFLYDLELRLEEGDRVCDIVSGYFGMRTVELKGRSFLLNGEAIFQRLVLDQGFYPDGIWTAPSDEALKKDIELSMAAGFNGARLHQKVFEPRFLYWADRLGYMVWGEYPNWGLEPGNPASFDTVLAEWAAIIARDFNHPSIIGWCPFNETTAKDIPLQAMVVDLTKRLDPFRPVLETSGYTHGVADPQLLDAHDYDQNPETFRKRWTAALCSQELPRRYGGLSVEVPFFVSEFGGIGWNVNKGAWGYGNTPQSLEEFYERYNGLTAALLDNRYCFAFCYTQLTDVEQEQNGIYDYHRNPKFDLAPVIKANTRKAAYECDPPLGLPSDSDAMQVLVGAAPDGDCASAWKYTMEKPAKDWMTVSFNDHAWKTGAGAFGKKEGSEHFIRTLWDTEQIWLRKSFSCTHDELDKALLVMHHDDDVEVYLNGKPLISLDRWNDRYEAFDVTEAVCSAMKKGANMLAIHGRQHHGGGQFIDAALLVSPKMKKADEMNIEKRTFGTTASGESVDIYTLTAAEDFKVEITNFGGIIVSIQTPDRNGSLADIVLGFDSLDKYEGKHPYFGAIVGRYGNRIANGRFDLDGRTYTLAQNDGENHLHGGIIGFDKAVWKAETLRREDAVGLVLTHRSPDGDEGYPGNLDCTVTYWVTRDKTLEIEYEAVTDKATPVNLTNHSYFNLDGHGSGAILNQALAIYAEYMTPVDSTLIPTGELRPVAGTPLDFRTPVAIGARIDTADEQLRFGKGYDHNFVIEKDPQGRMKRAARAHSARSGRVLECWTTEPGVQFYCGNFLDGSDVGKGGVVYHHRNAFCLETQHFPNSPNQPSFPTTILRPGEKYDSKTVYRFSAE